MSEIRLNAQWAQALTVPTTNVRVNFQFGQVQTEGYPKVRANFIQGQVQTEGYPQIRANLFQVQVAFPAAEEPNVSTVPFPGFGNSATNNSVPAAADPFNTPLPGLAFSVHKRPQFNTRISEAASGHEIRNALMDYPRWEFELTYEFLEDSSGAESSLKTIMGFFLSRQGSFDSWLFKDPDDYKVEGGLLGIADGVSPGFYLLRYIGDFGEPVGQVDTTNTINVYADGVLVDPGDYTVVLPNLIEFDSAPANGVEVTADFQFFFACRFIEDSMDFEKFSDKLWNLQECSFRSIIQ